jgi:hypothetical protein
LRLSDEQLKNYALIEIQESLESNGSSLRRFGGMPFPDRSIEMQRANKFISDELS